MRWMKLLVVSIAACSLAVTTFAKSPVNKTLLGGLAIKGYDTVNYFSARAPAKGSKSYQVEYNDAVWRFASQENLERFKDDPEKYIPQYGGYCAWAVSQGDTANIDPKSWKLVDGKLYLNYNKKIQKRWEKDQAVFIQQANKNWPAVLDK